MNLGNIVLYGSAAVGGTIGAVAGAYLGMFVVRLVVLVKTSPPY